MPATTPDLRGLAADSLRAHDELVTHLHRLPRRAPDDGKVWLAWAAMRDKLTANREAAVRLLINHPDYPALHRRLWRDDLTAAMPAVYVWAPVARVAVDGRHAPRIE